MNGDNGETQKALAEAADIDQGNLRRFKRGEATMSLETAAKVCQHLKLRLVAGR